jgi:crossover junction endodeoxyribonuclease RuvC
MIILGIDPGSRITGYGVVDVEDGRERVIEFGVLRMEEEDDHHLRLRRIHERLTAVIDRCLPDLCAIEMPVYARNAQSMLKLGRAQAAAMLAALVRDIPVVEYTPAEVKKSVTGNGAATKEQVGYMVRAILELEGGDDPMALDASDALAVSLCHAHRLRSSGAGHSSGWKQFVRENPGRVR